MLTEGALESPMYGTDSSVPDLMPSANPKSATLQLWDLTPDDDKARYLIRRGTQDLWFTDWWNQPDTPRISLNLIGLHESNVRFEIYVYFLQRER